MSANMKTDASTAAPTAATATRSPRVSIALLFRVGAALLIGLGLLWMVAAAPYALFLSVFGDCFENCEGYWGTWAESGRYSRLIVPLGQVTLVIALAAMFFRFAQVALAGVVFLMVATIVVDLAGFRALVVPVADVYLSHFAATFLVQMPAALFWLWGVALALVASRAFSDETGAQPRTASPQR